MMKTALLAMALAISPFTAIAQQYDSGWRIVQADALGDLEFTGSGVKVNNFTIAQAESPKANRTLVNYTFSASIVKRAAGKRSVRVEIVGFKADKTPTITSMVVANIYDEGVNKSTKEEHRFTAFPSEIEETANYFIRVLIP